MASMTSYLQKKLLDHMLGLAAFAIPATVYVSLHTADPTNTGSFANEVSTSGSGYVRIAATAKMNATDSVTGISANNVAITFGPALADWGTVTHVGISDGSSGGNMLLYGPLTVVQTTPIGESVQFSAGQFITQFD
jgi:hypothetical protein